MFFFFSITFAFAQTTFRVIDSITGYPLELATVRFLKSDYTIFTDLDGNFGAVPKGELCAEISYIGYKTRKVTLADNVKVILLEPAPNELSELVLESKKVNYSHAKTIKSTKKPEEYFGFQFGTEHCIYVDNPYRKTGKINSVTLYLSKLKNMDFIDRALGRDKNCKGCKVDYVASYKITFYEYDAVTKQPGRLLFDKGIVVNPKNKSYKFSVKLDSLAIPFPENGVCIGVEVVNTKYKDPKSTFAFIGPALGFYHYLINDAPRSWVRYRNEGWKFKNNVSGFDKGKTSNALAVDVEIKN